MAAIVEGMGIPSGLNHAQRALFARLVETGVNFVPRDRPDAESI